MDVMKLRRAVSDVLEGQLKAAGMTKLQLRKAAGLGKNTISAMTQHHNTPRLDTLIMVAEGFGIQPQSLLTDVLNEYYHGKS